MKKDELVFLDVETTGVEEEDRLCQLAYKVRDKRAVQRLFKPPLPISLVAMSVCHITNEMVADKEPFEGSLIHKKLKAGLGNGAILVAHNAAFDTELLKREGIETNRHICTMKLAHHFDKECKFEKHNLQYLRYFFNLEGLENIRTHEALSDVLVLEALFEQVFAKHYTIEEMLEISSKPIIYKKMMFGKYRGEFFEDIVKKDCNYLLWLRSNGENLDDNMKYTLNHYIARRIELLS